MSIKNEEATSISVIRWIQRAGRSFPQSSSELRFNWERLGKQLLDHGAVHINDFIGMSAGEMMELWPPFEGAPEGFVAHAIRLLDGTASSRSSRAVPETRSTVSCVAPQGQAPDVEVFPASLFQDCMGVLTVAKEDRVPPAPVVLAATLRKLSGMPRNSMERRWQCWQASPPPGLPKARAAWLQSLCQGGRQLFEQILREDTVWKLFAAWKASAAQYASAIQLWGEAARCVSCEPWPPSSRVLRMFTFLFTHGPSLVQYVSHIRSVLKLVSAPLGALDDVSALTRSSGKWSTNIYRFKPRASAAQTRSLAAVARTLDRGDVADSWVAARQFCLRYGADLIPLQSAGDHSAIDFAVDKKDRLCIASVTLFRRKMHTAPVVVSRRCICRLQSRQLCGVCTLRDRVGVGRVFPALSYVEGLAYLKSAAVRLGLERPTDWGTHAFRRGWADEVLKEGGPSALFYSGGWRGVTAFAYASARSRSAMEAAEWAIEFSDSSDDGKGA